MSEGPRDRRIGDATRQRIDGLAEGWRADKLRDSAPVVERPGTADDDSTVLRPSPADMAGTVPVEPLPTRPGVWGDVRYLFTVAVGVLRVRRERKAQRATLRREKADRRARVLSLARTAVADPDIEITAVKAAREEVAKIEDDRAQKAGAAAAAEAAVTKLTRERHDAAESARGQIEKLDTELVEVLRKLEPLDVREVELVGQRDALIANLEEVRGKIETERKKLERCATSDRPAIEAGIAALRADEDAVAHDQPAVEAALTELMPGLELLRDQRDRLQKELTRVKASDAEDAARTAESVDTLTAEQRDREQAAQARDNLRDATLYELGEALCHERPPALEPLLKHIDHHDAAIGTFERRLFELEAVMDAIDRWKLVRGLLLLLVPVMGVAAGYWLFLRS